MWQPSTSAGSSYWTNQMAGTSSVANTSPPASSGIQNISPTRSPGSPYATPSPSATYHPLTTPHNQQNYQATTPTTVEYQNNGSPHFHHTSSAAQPSLAVPQSHQLYYPPSLSPTHQIYGNVGFTNFSYAPGWTHGTAADYGIFQNSYHYQPSAEIFHSNISLINDGG